MNEDALRRVAKLAQADFAGYAKRFLKIMTKEGRMVPLEFNGPQRLINEAIEYQRKRHLPVRVIILKSRQLGSSTYAQAYLAHKAFCFEGQNCLTIAQSLDMAGELFGKLETMYRELPDAMRPPRDSGTRGKRLKLGSPLNGLLYVDTAENRDAGRSGTFQHVHCLAPWTQIPTADGCVKRIDEVVPGDLVLTHTGQPTEVVRVMTNTGKECITVQPWMSDPVTLSVDHPVWTKRGWVDAGELEKSDEVWMPRRRFAGQIYRRKLKREVHRTQGGGKPRKHELDWLELDEETGFAVGYYLAEGSIRKNKGIHPTGIQFSRHRDEKAYSDRAVAALNGTYTSVRSGSRDGTLTAFEVVNGSAIAELFASEFGEGSDKRIPDWVFSARKEFARGLLHGYLCGDGSKNNRALVSVSISSSLSVQVRDIALALGYGWSSLKYYEGGDRYGRECQPSWRATWAGRAANQLAFDAYGMEKRSDKIRNGHYKMLDDGVWVKIRSIEPSEYQGTTYDLMVEHEDHSFRTTSMSVKNCTELPFWPDAKRTMDGLLQSVPNKAGTSVIIESTAAGMGDYFHKTWEGAVAGTNNFIPIFLPWYEMEEYQRPHLKDDFPLDKRIQELQREFKLPNERAVWYQDKLRDMNNDWDKLCQEYPTTAEVAFLTSGSPFFHPNTIEYYTKLVEEPKRKGMYHRTSSGPAWKDDPQGDIWIWEEPKPDADYVIGVDVATGRAQDNSSIHVLRGTTQVASYHGRHEPDQLAEIAAWLGYAYNTALLAPERNSIGIAMILPLVNDIQYPNIYQHERRDTTQLTESQSYGWPTTASTRPAMLENLAALSRTGELELRCERTLREMRTFTFQDDLGKKAEANQGANDDMVMALAIALAVADHASGGEVEMVRRRGKYRF